MKKNIIKISVVLLLVVSVVYGIMSLCNIDLCSPKVNGSELYGSLKHLRWYEAPAVEDAAQPVRLVEVTKNVDSEFLKQLPAPWDQSLMLDFVKGKYGVVARRNSRIWYVGAYTGKAGRQIEIDYQFLHNAVEYETICYRDCVDAAGVRSEKIDTAYLTKADIVKYELEKCSSMTIIARPARVAEGLTKRVIVPELPASVKVTHEHSNPLRQALEPLDPASIFKMEGYGLWDPSVIKVGDTYHLFCSRWPLAKGWFYSEVIRATSKSLFGPYEFQEVVLSAATHPWATQGTHNPKIMKVGDRYLLYHLGIPKFQTGFAYADNIEGPWEVMDKPVIQTNNPAIVVHEDGSAYAIGKFTRINDNARDGLYDACMRAFTAPSVNGPYTVVKDMGNRLPNEFEYEDPSVCWANNKYHVICTDWEGKVTGVQKSLIYYTSKDGVEYELYSQIPIWNQADAIPMTDGTETYISQIERPEVYINEDGEFEALLVGVISRPEDFGKVKDNHIMIRKVKGFEIE